MQTAIGTRTGVVVSRRGPLTTNRRLLSKSLGTKRAAKPSLRRKVTKTTRGRSVRAEATVKESYDVYVAESTPLQEGESKHTISIFVADEPGLINRVAGVFGRRGSNIESLAVGLNNERALFTIVANGTDQTINNLVKQLSKLVKVRYVEDISIARRIDRELVLIKVPASAGEQRTEVLQFCDIFRAKVVDVADNFITASVIGDPGKIASFESRLNKFGIKELVRTGNISLKRGENFLEPDIQNDEKRKTKRKPSKSSKKGGKESEEHDGADVYIVEDDVEGVWDVETLMTDDESSTDAHFQSYTLQIEVDNSPGVLNQVTGVFSRRGYNVQSLAVGPSEKPGRSRICMVVPGDDQSVSKLVKQLYKLVNVQNIVDMTKIPFVARELMLIKVKCEPEKRMELETLATIFRGSVCDVSYKTVTLEIQGKPRKMSAFLEIVEPYGILEVARTGVIALSRESKVSSEFLQHVQRSKIY